MSKNTTFSEAHILAKEIRSNFDTYQEAFTFALNKLRTNHLSKSEKLLNLGLKIYRNGDQEHIYLNTDESIKVAFGLNIERNKHKQIKSAKMNGREVSTSFAAAMISRRIYFCLKEQSFFGTSMTPIL